MDAIIKEDIVRCQKCGMLYFISQFRLENDPLFPEEFAYIYCDKCKRELFEKVTKYAN